jgi:hypothetical protein
MSDKAKQKISDLIQTYCGMPEARAANLESVARGEKISSASLHHFKSPNHKLVDRSDKLTDIGTDVLQRIQSIRAGTYEPLHPDIEPALLNTINLLKVTHYPMVRQAGMKSVHLKILRLVATIPLVAYGHLLIAFTYDNIDDVITKGFISGDKFNKYCSLRLTEKGKAFILDICKEQTNRAGTPA